MKKKEYRDEIKSVKSDISKLNKLMTQIELDYIEDNKPCDLEDEVEIILGSDRRVKGVVASFGILVDATVCITSYKDGSQTKYITTPHKKVTVI